MVNALLKKRRRVSPNLKKTQTMRQSLEWTKIQFLDKQTYCTQAFDFSAESLSIDGGGRFVTWFILSIAWKNIPVDHGGLVAQHLCVILEPYKMCWWPLDSSFKHFVFSYKDRGGSDIQGVAWTLESTATCSTNLTPKCLAVFLM